MKSWVSSEHHAWFLCISEYAGRNANHITPNHQQRFAWYRQTTFSDYHGTLNMFCMLKLMLNVHTWKLCRCQRRAPVFPALYRSCRSTRAGRCRRLRSVTRSHQSGRGQDRPLPAVWTMHLQSLCVPSCAERYHMPPWCSLPSCLHQGNITSGTTVTKKHPFSVDVICLF